MVSKPNSNYSNILKSILFLFSVIILIGFVSAATLNVNPDFLNERNVIVAAADRIIDLQDSSGSWDWVVTDKTGPTGTYYLNIAGVTAEVLLDAYKLTGDSKYLNAAKNAGDYLIAQMGSSTIDITKRSNAFSINFLYDLGQISGEDKYTDEADALLDNTLHETNYWASHNGNYCVIDGGCTAEQLFNAVSNYRGENLEIVMWDMAPWVKAAETRGKTEWANNLKTIMNSHYLDLESESDYYIIGLSGLVLGTENSDAVSDLITEQDTEGFWSDPNGIIQDTAYALMALKQGW